MMRKAQDRAGLHGGLGGLQGMKALAGFGATLASNKFVRAAIREEVRPIIFFTNRVVSEYDMRVSRPARMHLVR